MIQLNNGFKDYYYIDESNYKLFNAKSKRYLSLNSSGSYQLTKEDGTIKHITNNRLLKLVFGSGFVLKDIESLPDEQWKQINDSGYFVSSLGRVKSNLSLESRVLLPELSNGYYRVKINIGYGLKNYTIHKLVALYFLDTPNQPFCEIHHLNNLRTDNRAQNLQFLTRDEHKKLHKQLKKADKQKENTNE